MASRIEIVGSTIPIGTIITAYGAPDSTWKLCDGSILLQADYLAYVSNSLDLHPYRWNNWKRYPIDNPSSYNRTAISNIGDLVVVIGTNNLVNVSTDGGINWSYNNNLPTWSGSWVIENDGSKFVALQSVGSVGVYSSDGVTWTPTSLGASAPSGWKIYYNGTYFLGWHGGTSPDTLIYSSDGITWNIKSGKPWGAAEGSYNCGTDGTKFLVWSGSGYTSLFYTSTNCVSWTAGTLPWDPDLPDNEGYYGQLIYFNDRWLYINTDGYQNHYFWNSGDPLEPDEWYFEKFPASPLINSNAYDAYYDTAWIITGNDLILPMSYSNLALTTDGINWQGRYTMYWTVRDLAAKDEDWLIAISDYTTINRTDYTSYINSTHFQIPYHASVEAPGIYKYIKLLE